MDDYDYVMHGKIFRIETSLSTDNQQKLYVSFGGLLMLLGCASTTLRVLARFHSLKV